MQIVNTATYPQRSDSIRIVSLNRKTGGKLKVEQSFEEKLHQAYSIMAEMVCDHGDQFLPVFKRLHEELELNNAKRNLRCIALEVAKKRPQRHDSSIDK